MPASKISTTPVKKGIRARISHNSFRRVALHATMERVGDCNETAATQVKATLTAATLDTVYEGVVNDVYVWQQVQE
jgi:hypothetical protein